MKKLFKRSLLALTALVITIALPAQTLMKDTGVTKQTLDTVSDNGVKLLALKVPGPSQTITATLTYTKISGTLGGTIVPVASNDGVKFYDVSQVSKDTLTVGNASGGKSYSFQKGWLWYGLRWTGTGTMSGSFSAMMLSRQ